MRRISRLRIHPTFTVRRNLSTTRNCPSCGALLLSPLPACTSCRYISAVPQETRYEELLGIEPDRDANPFVLDQEQLRKSFLKSQRVCHPDTWQGVGEEKTRIASQHSMLLNTAFGTMKDPLLRAQYIISRDGGIKEGEEDKMEDAQLITQVMDAREAVEEVTSSEKLANLDQENKARIQTTLVDIQRHIGERSWQEASAAAVRLKYWRGIADAIQGRR